MNDFILALVASYIKKSIKNPDKKRKMRNICKEIFDALKIAFAGDPDFE
jgi:hypothetical protein